MADKGPALGAGEQMADLHTIGNGKAAVKFAAELARVMGNILDPDTKATAKRKIVLEFILEPDEHRHAIATSILAKSTLAPAVPAADMIWVAPRSGKVYATVVHPEPPAEVPNVLSFPIPATATEGS